MKYFVFVTSIGIGMFILAHSDINHRKEIKYLNETIKLQEELIVLQEEKIELYEDIIEDIFEQIPTTKFSLPVTVTAYSAREEECDSTPWVTADMTPSRVGIVAVSRDLLEEIGLEYGQQIILEGLGVFKVRDTMNSRWKRRVDILMAHPKAAKLFGKKQTKLIWVS